MTPSRALLGGGVLAVLVLLSCGGPQDRGLVQGDDIHMTDLGSSPGIDLGDITPIEDMHESCGFRCVNGMWNPAFFCSSGKICQWPTAWSCFPEGSSYASSCVPAPPPAPADGGTDAGAP